MKDNNIPQKERLKTHIHRLEMKKDSMWGRFGGGNPYRRCKGCDKAEPEISISDHASYCPFKGLDKEIEYYERLLDEV